MSKSLIIDVYATAIKEYESKRPMELALKVGDVIKVTKQGGPRWIGTLNGKVGSFPADCVELTPNAEIKQEEIESTLPKTLHLSMGGPPPSSPLFYSSPTPGGRGRGRGRPPIVQPNVRHSSYTPAELPIKPPPLQRPQSNYTPSQPFDPNDDSISLPTLPPPPSVIDPSAIPATLPPPPSIYHSDSSLPPPPSIDQIDHLISMNDASLLQTLPPPPPPLSDEVPSPVVAKFPPPFKTPINLPPPPAPIHLPPLPIISDIADIPPPPPPEEEPSSDVPEPEPSEPEPEPEQPEETPTESPPDSDAQETPKEVESETPAPDAPKKRTKADLRQNCLNEIYQTEKDYIDDLQVLINVFIFPLRAMQTVPESTLYSIFSNVEVLVGCNQEMLRGLGDKMEGKEGVDVTIGEVFTKLADYFKMYKVFCANQTTSLTTVEQLKKNPQFKKNLDVCHTDPRCKGLFLQSFLIKPIQRVCKYPLLLRELISHTPEDHPDYIPLQNAFSKINEVVANINEGQRQAEGLSRIIELQKLIDGINDTLIAPNRNLHKEDDLNFFKTQKSKHPEKRHVFCFTDLIMLTTKKDDKKFVHKVSISLDGCKITVLANSQHIKNAFELQQAKNKVILACESEREAAEWVNAIKGLIKEYQKRKIREVKEAQEKGLTLLSTSLSS